MLNINFFIIGKYLLVIKVIYNLSLLFSLIISVKHYFQILQLDSYFVSTFIAGRNVLLFAK